MHTEKRPYRSHNALLGGVCAGVAEYFSIDPLVARILVVALTLLSAGACAIAYGALWIILPRSPLSASPLEVAPHSVRSDTYGQMDYEVMPMRSGEPLRVAAENIASNQAPSCQAYVGSGHVPPQPPVAATAAWAQAARQAAPAGWQAPSWQAPTWVSSGATTPDIQTPSCVPPEKEVPGAAYVPVSEQRPPVPQQVSWQNSRPSASVSSPGWPAQSPVAAPQQVTSVAPRKSGGVKVALFIGSVLLFLGIAVLLGQFSKGISWWQLWPLVFIIMGIVQMVVPGEPGRRTGHFVGGLFLFCFGATLLCMSLGMVHWITLVYMAKNLWPLLLAMSGLFIIGIATHCSWWTFAAGLCFMAFCVMGLFWYAVPGSVDTLVLTLPFGREFSVPFGPHSPWLL